MFQYVYPNAIEVEPVQPNTIGMHRVCLTVDNIDAALEIAAGHGCHPLRGVATYEDVYKLTYLRGPSGILVMFAEELKGRLTRPPWETALAATTRPRTVDNGSPRSRAGLRPARRCVSSLRCGPHRRARF